MRKPIFEQFHCYPYFIVTDIRYSCWKIVEDGRHPVLTQDSWGNNMEHYAALKRLWRKDKRKFRRAIALYLSRQSKGSILDNINYVIGNK